jgi:HlyD family secretion protein
MTRLHRIVAGAVVLSAAGVFITYRSMSASDAADDILASGTVEARQADLGFQLAGRVEAIGAREGDRVVAGAELASLENAELEAQRAMAAAQQRAAQAQLDELLAGSRREEIARARAALDVAVERREAARRDVDRLRPLAEKELVSRQDFDHQRTALGVAEGEASKAGEDLQLLEKGPRKERIEAQRASVAQAAATVARIDATLAQSVLRAPFGGTIVVKHREAGEAIPAGAPVLTIRDLGDRWVRLYVPGDEVGRLHLGQKATVTADGWADRKYAGTISHIASVAEFTPRNVQTTKDRVKLVYEVRVRITGDSAVDLKPGIPADVRFGADRPAAR